MPGVGACFGEDRCRSCERCSQRCEIFSVVLFILSWCRGIPLRAVLLYCGGRADGERWFVSHVYIKQHALLGRGGAGL